MALEALTPYVAAQTVFGVVMGVVLLAVARMTLREYERSRFPTPARMFAMWWGCLGAAWLAWALDTLLVTSGARGAAAAVFDYALIVLYFALILMAFASLFYYLLFIYIGSARLAWTVWVIYGAATAALTALLLTASPPWNFEVSGLYAPRLFGEYTAWANALRVILLLPIMVAAVALFALVRKSPERRQRYRVLLIASSLTFYLVMPLFFGSNPGIEPTSAAAWAREAANKAGLLVAVSAVILAYRPPGWLSRRLGIAEEGGR